MGANASSHATASVQRDSNVRMRSIASVAAACGHQEHRLPHAPVGVAAFVEHGVGDVLADAAVQHRHALAVPVQLAHRRQLVEDAGHHGEQPRDPPPAGVVGERAAERDVVGEGGADAGGRGREQMRHEGGGHQQLLLASDIEAS